jgi:hypothetical protein
LDTTKKERAIPKQNREFWEIIKNSLSLAEWERLWSKDVEIIAKVRKLLEGGLLCQ